MAMLANKGKKFKPLGKKVVKSKLFYAKPSSAHCVMPEKHQESVTGVTEPISQTVTNVSDSKVTHQLESSVARRIGGECQVGSPRHRGSVNSASASSSVISSETMPQMKLLMINSSVLFIMSTHKV